MTSIDIDALRKQFNSLGCPGAVALLDFLMSEARQGRHIVKIGSATIDLHGQIAIFKSQPRTEREIEAFIDRLPAFHFGRTDGKKTPFDYLVELAEVLSERPPGDRAKLDQFCKDLAAPDPETYKMIIGKLIVHAKTQ